LLIALLGVLAIPVGGVFALAGGVIMGIILLIWGIISLPLRLFGIDPFAWVRADKWTERFENLTAKVHDQVDEL